MYNVSYWRFSYSRTCDHAPSVRQLGDAGPRQRRASPSSQHAQHGASQHVLCSAQQLRPCPKAGAPEGSLSTTSCQPPKSEVGCVVADYGMDRSPRYAEVKSMEVQTTQYMYPQHIPPSSKHSIPVRPRRQLQSRDARIRPSPLSPVLQQPIYPT
jgi:hypothetical protein